MEATMTFNARTARRLCSDSEVELFEQSRQFELQNLSEKQLKTGISRARKQYEKLARQAQRPRAKDPDVATKAALMHEILARFERQLVRLMMNAKEEGRSHDTPPEIGDGADYVRLGPPSEDVRARAHADETAQGAARRIEGMISSRDRRSQIRHDKR
jgi:hypothetical protein